MVAESENGLLSFGVFKVPTNEVHGLDVAVREKLEDVGGMFQHAPCFIYRSSQIIEPLVDWGRILADVFRMISSCSSSSESTTKLSTLSHLEFRSICL
jgi:hypothetical protein